MIKKDFALTLMERLARDLGISFEIDKRFGHVARVIRADGRVRYARDTMFDVNQAGAAEVARDKDYTAYFLRKSGYPVPIGEAFFTPEWASAIGSDRTPERAWKYAQSLGLPVIVKPNSKMQGQGVSRVSTKVDFFMAVHRASVDERIFLVQKPVLGKDYRIVVYDNTVIAAYERLPLSIVGDGKSSIAQLLQKKRRQKGRHVHVNDQRILDTLHEQKLTLESILPRREHICVLPNANLSTGGDAIDLTESLHDHWKSLAVRIARAMNLCYVGIDIIAPTPLSESPGNYTIIEVNAAAGLEHYAALGKKQLSRVRELYAKILQDMAR